MNQHALIAADADSLLRWQQAFTEASIFASPDAVPGSLPAGTIVWLHLPADQHAVAELAAATVKAVAPCPVVAMSDTPDDQQCLALMNLGVVGYCHAYAGAALLKQVATVVSNKGLWVRPAVLNRLIRAAKSIAPGDTSANQTRVDIDCLSTREREVAAAVARGLSNKEIARELDITERTVKAHLSAVFGKLEVRDRVHLALRMRDYSDLQNE